MQQRSVALKESIVFTAVMRELNMNMREDMGAQLIVDNPSMFSNKELLDAKALLSYYIVRPR